MKKISAIFVYILLLILNSGKAQLVVADTIKTKLGSIVVQPIFHGALVLTVGYKTIYVDPYNSITSYKKLSKPDLILITDIHQDHLDTIILNELNTANAKFIVPRAVKDNLPIGLKNKTTILNNWETIKDSSISITAIPMYNLPAESNSRHPKGRGNGYILEYAGKRIYISGDTEDTDEMRNLKNIDVAFICMNQPYTMTIQQAASAVLSFKPKIIYPYHYRNFDGYSDVDAFKTIVKKSNNNIDVRIRNWYSEESFSSKATKIENVVYGTFSGASLTMNIYKPDLSNKIGIIIIPGSAFGYAYSSDYNQPAMTEIFELDTTYFGKYAKLLVNKGFTIFVINHRFSPKFQFTDIISDCQRAVQYIRFNSKKFDIDYNNIGAMGYSSGATLCAMLGVTSRSVSSRETAMDTVSSKVQAVVTLAGRFDLSDFNKKEDSLIQNPIISRVLLNYIGELPCVEDGNYILKGKYADASPINFVNKSTAPFLIYCSTDDPLVPYRQSNNMYYKLLDNGVKSKLKTSKNEGHTPIPDIQEIEFWFLKQLKK